MTIFRGGGDPGIAAGGVTNAVPDGDYGNISVSNNGGIWTIDNGVVETANLGGDITTAGKALLDDATAADQRTTLGLGSIATQDSNNVTITGGSISGITDLALADGGTGASLVDPNADRLMFWDDSAGAVTWLTAGTGLSITDTTIAATTLSDGDKGDISVSSSGAIWTIDNGVVTASKLASGAVEGAITAALSSKNKFINGSMSIDQRNAGAAKTITAAAALAYTIDRWYAYCTGANVTGQRVAGTAPNQYNYRFTGAASVTKIGFAQRIEAANCQDLANTTATLAVDLANSLLTTVTWTAWYANSADTFGTLASPTRTQIATGMFTVNSTLTRYSTNISIPSAATTGIEIEFSVGAQTSGTWTIGRVQLEAGSVATPFETRSVGQELALCQRYYYRYTAGTAGDGMGVGFCNSTTAARAILNFPVMMRTGPTAIEQSGTAGDYSIAIKADGAIACSSVPIWGVASTDQARTNFTVASGLTAGEAMIVRAVNTNAYLGWSAEL